MLSSVLNTGVAMRLPPHPLWFWLILGSPSVIWLVLWIAVQYKQVSLRPLTSWLKAGFFLFLPAFIVLEEMEGHKALRLAVGAIFYTCWTLQLWIERRYMFETIRGPAAKWYVPWTTARFTLPKNARIRVRDIDSLSHWYTDKLGLQKAAENPWGEHDGTTYKFKEGGKSITLTTKASYGTDKTLILFTKTIDRMKGVLSARGIEGGPIERDRQRTRYFEIRDPEGNAIEVVEEP
jgi:catechol 2,3-dioxygenase-like lactoylglutathione lyase family enzyme